MFSTYVNMKCLQLCKVFKVWDICFNVREMDLGMGVINTYSYLETDPRGYFWKAEDI